MKGAPAKPISGTRSASAFRASRTVSKTNGTASSTATGRKPRHVLGAPDRTLDVRPLAAGELEADAERLEHEQDVGEEDRGVHAEPLHRLERHLGRGRAGSCRARGTRGARAARGTRACSARPGA